MHCNLVNKLLSIITFSILLLIPLVSEVSAGLQTTITVIKTIHGGQLTANDFDYFIRDSNNVETPVQNGIPTIVTPGAFVIHEGFPEPIEDPPEDPIEVVQLLREKQYMAFFSGDCIPGSSNDNEQKMIFDQVSKATALQEAIDSNPDDIDGNEDKLQLIHPLFTKAIVLLGALQGTVNIQTGENLECEITNIYTPSIVEADKTVKPTSSAGDFKFFTSIPEPPATGKPTGITTPLGFWTWKVSDLQLGQAVTLTLKPDTAFPNDIQFWKIIDGVWIDASEVLGDNDGDNELTITITDGGPFDADKTVNGMVSDPGVLVFPTSMIGGKIISIESASLILAVAQSFSWMIPVMLSIIGIGLVIIRRK